MEYRTNDWSTYEGPGAEYFQRPELALYVTNDPLEPTNRRTWGFNDGFATVMRPIATGYRYVVPRVVRTGINNFFTNLLYPVRLVNNLLQGKGGGAWDETKRFAVNTTVGILGFLDAAGDMPRSDEDLGQTLGSYGWEDPSFLVLPFLGPSTTRDAVGFVGDAFLDPAFYYMPAPVVSRANSASDQIEEVKRLEESNYDLYRLAQGVGSIDRAIEVEDYVHPDEVCVHCVAQETIQAIFLTFRDKDFPRKADHRTVALPEPPADAPDADARAARRAAGAPEPRSVEYTLFLQPEPAPIVYILPGLGGHRISDSAFGLAEMVYRQGLSAVTISNAMNFEFIATASSAQLPGFAPVDALDVHRALDAVHRDVEARHPDRVTDHVLMGLSLGAFHTLYIATHELRPGLDLVPFDRYVAINPPVKLEVGMHQLDAYYNAPLGLDPATIEGFLEHTFRKVIEEAGSLRPGKPLPFNETEAQFLIGLAFRQTLQDILFQTQLRRNRGVLQTELKRSDRGPAYREIGEYSYLEYFYAFLLPSYAEVRDDVGLDEAGARRLFELCDLRSLERELRANEKVQVVTNADDFLLDEADLAWLRDVFGARTHHFEHGGHLGNLYTPTVQDRVMEAVLGGMPGMGEPDAAGDAMMGGS